MKDIKKREMTGKALRMDSRMSKDLERLSDFTGYSQNELILKAIRNYLMLHKSIFYREMIKDVYLSQMDRNIAFMKEECHLTIGVMTLDITKTQKENVYNARMVVKNKYKKAIFDDLKEVNIATRDWEKYKEYVTENIMKYVDLDSDEFSEYFYERFSYD